MASTYTLDELYQQYNATRFGDKCHLGTRCTDTNNLLIEEPSFCDVGCVVFIVIMGIIAVLFVITFFRCLWLSRRKFESARALFIAPPTAREGQQNSPKKQKDDPSAAKVTIPVVVDPAVDKKTTNDSLKEPGSLVVPTTTTAAAATSTAAGTTTVVTVISPQDDDDKNKNKSSGTGEAAPPPTTATTATTSANDASNSSLKIGNSVTRCGCCAAASSDSDEDDDNSNNNNNNTNMVAELDEKGNPKPHKTSRSNNPNKKSKKKHGKRDGTRSGDPELRFLDEVDLDEADSEESIVSMVSNRTIRQHCKAFQFKPETFLAAVVAARNCAKSETRDKGLEKLEILSEMGHEIYRSAKKASSPDSLQIELCFAHKIRTMMRQYSEGKVYRHELVAFEKKLFESIEHFDTVWTMQNIAECARSIDDDDSKLTEDTPVSTELGCLFVYAVALREFDSPDRLSRASQLGMTAAETARLSIEIRKLKKSVAIDNDDERENLTRDEFIKVFKAAVHPDEDESSARGPTKSVLNRLFVLARDKLPVRRLLNSASQEADSQNRSFVQYFTSSILLRTKYANLLALYIPYLVLFTIFMLFGLGYDEAYLMHLSVHQSFVNDRLTTVDTSKFPKSCSPSCKFYENFFMAFDEVAFVADLTSWIKASFLPVLWPYPDQPVSTFRFNGVVPVGALKIRQVKSKPYASQERADAYFWTKNPTANETAVINDWFRTNESSYPSLGLIHPPYTESSKWKVDAAHRSDIFNNPAVDSRIKDAFRYRDGDQLNASEYFNGKNVFVGPGGFALIVPFSSNGTYAHNLVNTLFTKNWVDMDTRAIIFEMYFYNNQLHILHRLRVMFETTTGGLYIPHTDAVATNVFNFGSHTFGFFIFLSVFFAYLFIYIVPSGFFYFFYSIPRHAMRRRREEGVKHYFRAVAGDSCFNSWAVMLLLNSIVQTIAWGLRIYQFTFTTGSLGNDLFQAEYIPSSFSTLAAVQSASYYISALAIAVAYFIPLFYLTYQNDGLAVVARTVQRAAGPLMSLVIVSVMMLAAFAVCAFVAYGAVLPDYRNPGRALGQILLAVIGEYDYDEWRAVHLTFSAVFFFLMTVLLEILLLNMIVSILMDSFDKEFDDLFDEAGTKLLIQNDPFVQVPFPSRAEQFKFSPFYNGMQTRVLKGLAYFKFCIHKIEATIGMQPKNCFVHPNYSLKMALEEIENHDHLTYWSAMNDAVENIQFGSFDESFAGQFHICTQLMPMVSENFDDLASVLLNAEVELGEANIEADRHRLHRKTKGTYMGPTTSFTAGALFAREKQPGSPAKSSKKGSPTSPAPPTSASSSSSSPSSSSHGKNGDALLASAPGGEINNGAQEDQDGGEFDFHSHKNKRTLKDKLQSEFGNVRTSLLLFQAMPNFHLLVPSSVLLLTALETRHRWAQEISTFTLRTDEDARLDPRHACLALEKLSREIDDAKSTKTFSQTVDDVTGTKVVRVKKVLARRGMKQALLPVVTEKERSQLLLALEVYMESNPDVDGVPTERFNEEWNTLRIGMPKTHQQQTFYVAKKPHHHQHSPSPAAAAATTNSLVVSNVSTSNPSNNDNNNNNIIINNEPITPAAAAATVSQEALLPTTDPTDKASPHDVVVAVQGADSDDDEDSASSSSGSDSDHSDGHRENKNNTAPDAAATTTTTLQAENQASVTKSGAAATSSAANSAIVQDKNQVLEIEKTLFPNRDAYRSQASDFYDISEMVNGVPYMGRATILAFLQECVHNWGEERKQWLAIRWDRKKVADFFSAVRAHNPTFNFEQTIIDEPEPGVAVDGVSKLGPVRDPSNKKTKRNLPTTSSQASPSLASAEVVSFAPDAAASPDINDNNNNNNTNNNNIDHDAQQQQEQQQQQPLFVNNTNFDPTVDQQEEVQQSTRPRSNKSKSKNKHVLLIPNEFMIGWEAATGGTSIPRLVQRALVGTTYEEFFAFATKNSRQSLQFFDLFSVFMARASTLFFNTFAYCCFVVLFTYFACANRGIDELVWFTEGTKESYATQQYLFQSLDNGINSTTTGPNIVDSQFINIHDVQNWIQFVEQIVIAGAYTNPDTSTGRWVSQTNQETPLGSIVIRQTRKKKQRCVGELDPLFPVNEPDLTTRPDLIGRVAVLQPFCVDGEGDDDDQPFGDPNILSGVDPLVKNAFSYRSCDDLHLAGGYSNDYGSISCDGYALALSLGDNSTTVTSRFRSLIRSGWIDDQTNVLAVNMIVFNYNLNYFARWRFFLQITRGGQVYPTYDVSHVRPWIASEHSTAYKVFLGIFFVSVLLQGYATLSTIYDDYRRERDIGSKRPVALFRALTDDVWWIINLSNVVILIVLWSTRYALMIKSTDDIVVFRSQVGRRIEQLAELSVYFDLIEAFCAILTYFRVAYYLRSFPSLNLLARTLFIATSEIWSLVIIFVVVFLGFGLAAFLIVGQGVFNFCTLELALGTLFRALLGADVDFKTMIELHPVWTGVYYTAFTIVCEFVLFNLIIAVLNDSLDKARSETADTEHFEKAVECDSRNGNVLRYKKYEFLGPLSSTVGVLYTEAKFVFQQIRNVIAKPCVAPETWEIYSIQTTQHPEKFWKTFLTCSQSPNPLRAYMRWRELIKRERVMFGGTEAADNDLPEILPHPGQDGDDEKKSSSSSSGGGGVAAVGSPTFAALNQQQQQKQQAQQQSQRQMTDTNVVAAAATPPRDDVDQSVLVPATFTRIIADFDIAESYDDNSAVRDQGSQWEGCGEGNKGNRASNEGDDGDDEGQGEDDDEQQRGTVLRVRRVGEALYDRLGEICDRAVNLAVFANVATKAPATNILAQMMQRRHEFLMEKEDVEGRNINHVVNLAKEVVRKLRSFGDGASEGDDFTKTRRALLRRRANQQQKETADDDDGDDDLNQSDFDNEDSVPLYAASRVKKGLAQQMQDAADAYWRGEMRMIDKPRDFDDVPVSCPAQSKKRHEINQSPSVFRIVSHVKREESVVESRSKIASGVAASNAPDAVDGGAAAVDADVTATPANKEGDDGAAHPSAVPETCSTSILTTEVKSDEQSTTNRQQENTEPAKENEGNTNKTKDETKQPESSQEVTTTTTTNTDDQQQQQQQQG